jgi:Na+-driven multidrug efflux pump
MESLSKPSWTGVRARVRNALRQELRPMATLAAPLVLAEVGWMAMGVVDTMMVGRVGAEAVAAVSLGTMVFYAVGMFASGLLLGLDTLVARRTAHRIARIAGALSTVCGCRSGPDWWP